MRGQIGPLRGIVSQRSDRGAWARLGPFVGTALFLSILAVPTASSDTLVGGSITGPETWTLAGSPYVLVDDLTIESNGSLTIEAGVEVRAEAGRILIVYGSLSAQGDPVPGGTGHVWFHAADLGAPAYWRGIELRGYGFASLMGARVNDAEVGLRVLTTGTDPGQGRLYVHDSLFEGNDVGLDLGTSAYNYVVNSSFSENALLGVNGSLGNLFKDNTIRANGAGLVSTGDWSGMYTYVTFTGNVIEDNLGSGVVVDAAMGQGDIRCNAFTGNGKGAPNLGYGLRLASSNLGELVISQNNFVDNALQAEDAGLNAWDDGAAGNYWSDYNGTDADGDGIGETPYAVDVDTEDRFPYVMPLDIRGDCPPTGPPPDTQIGAPTGLWAELTGAALEDLELTWVPSIDDGAGENDILGYEVFCGESYASDGAGYALEASLPPGSDTHTLPGAGHGDPANRFCYVEARDDGNNTARSGQAGKFTQFLPSGMRLVSFLLIQSDTSVTRVFQTVSYVRLIHYDKQSGKANNWRTYDTRKPYHDLTDADHTMALWAEVTSDSWFTVAGQVPAATNILLGVGWNFVGYPSLLDRLISESLAGLDVQRVEGYDVQGPWHLRKMETSELLEAGNGYWIHVSSTQTWVVEN